LSKKISEVNEVYKDKLEILRQRIPIGLRHGLTLLESLDGDLEKAEVKFREEMVAIIISKTGVTADVAIKHLTKNNFDIAATIKDIDEERYTFTELVLRKFKDKKEDALDKIAYAIQEKYNLKKEFWLNFNTLKELPSELYCLMAIWEWLNYESWEDYGSALSFNLDIVADQIGNKLGLTELANSVKQAKDIRTLIYTRYRIDKGIKDYVAASNELQRHEEYKKYENVYVTQRPMLIDRLYELVKNNIDKFP
jgi:hypothetical protein